MAEENPKDELELKVDRAIAEFLETERTNPAASPETWVQAHSDIATQLLEFLSDREGFREAARHVMPQLHAGVPGMENAAAESPTIPPSIPKADRGDTPADAGTLKPRSARPLRQTFGDYELIEEIARGGMGVVYRARQLSLNRIVGLKMILAGEFAEQADVDRFYAEAAAAANLKHPNIVAVHEIGEHHGHHFFSMDYVEGEDLAESVRKEAMPATRVASLVQDIASAIQYAHEQGIIHRDLKPSNVLVDEAGDVHVTDFGLAKRLRDDSGLTGTGQVLGTPGYMPPEQAAGRIDQIDARSDVYSLGAILYELLTGRPPFRSETPLDTLLQVLHDEPVSPRTLNPKVPRDLETICLKCLEKDPARRYHSASDLREELERFLCGEPIQARPITRAAKLWRLCRRKPVVACLIAMLLISVLAGLAGTSTGWIRASNEAERTQHLLYVSHLAAEDSAFHYQLSNGLSVLLRPVSGAKQVSLTVLYNIGNDHDPAGKSGMAHYLEHLYVTAATPKSSARTIQQYLQRYPLGWNAQTGDRYTVIASVVEREKLESELEDAALRMSALQIVQSDLDRERPRMIEELYGMYEGHPMLVARNQARALARPSPPGNRAGGVPDQIRSISMAELQSRWERFYRPNNAILALAGDLDVPAVRKMIKTHFDPIARGRDIPAPRPADPPSFGATRSFPKPIAQIPGEVCFGFASPDPTHEDFPAFLIQAMRLFQRGRLMASSPMDIPVIFEPLDDAGILYVRTSMREGENKEAALQRMQTFLDESLSKELHRNDLAMAKMQFGFLLGTMQLPDFTLAQNLYGTAFRMGRRIQLQIPLELNENIEKLTNEAVHAVGKKYFAPQRKVTVIVE